MWVRVPPPVPSQNTFASTETQRHVKPLRMIDEVCFEMANIKQMRLAEHEGLKLMRFLRFALRKTRAFLTPLRRA